MKDIEYEPKKTSDTLDYTEFDDFLEALGSEISSLGSADDLLSNLESDMKNSLEQIKNSDVKTKRRLSATIDDSYYTNVLAQDADFHVRTLALCNPATSSAVLKKLTDSFLEDDFTLMIIAHNPNTDADTLNRIFTYGGGKEDIRRAISENPNCNEALRFKIEDWIKRRVD